MSIYFSNFNNVDLKHQTSQGLAFCDQVAFCDQEMPLYPLENPYSLKGPSSYSSSYDNMSLHSSSPENKWDSNPFSYHCGGRSKTDDIGLSMHINKMRE